LYGKIGPADLRNSLANAERLTERKSLVLRKSHNAPPQLHYFRKLSHQDYFSFPALSGKLNGATVVKMANGRHSSAGAKFDVIEETRDLSY
jgi:hypothetical protein